MVIGTDCIGSCKSYYHTVTTTTAPNSIMVMYCSEYKICFVQDFILSALQWFHVQIPGGFIKKCCAFYFQSGVYSAIPHIAKVFAAFASGHIADRLLLKCSTTVVRKILTSVGR